MMKSKEDSKTTIEVELESSLGCNGGCDRSINHPIIKSFVLQAAVPQWTTCS